MLQAAACTFSPQSPFECKADIALGASSARRPLTATIAPAPRKAIALLRGLSLLDDPRFEEVAFERRLVHRVLLFRMESIHPALGAIGPAEDTYPRVVIPELQAVQLVVLD